MIKILLTKNNKGLNLCLALNYGSRQEIVEAVQLIAKKVVKREIRVEDINENVPHQPNYRSQKIAVIILKLMHLVL